ncbi:hypothetical protein CDL15_Pgr004576 [Punica granatum]|uniref:Uncharacterized protein n=1 Tax=Punica granatum TaxID=22663 RepID=A0A218WQN4_PUNGR|nr:hypothetical protein CDL15_Pgr004576 [Punica granatum]
MVHGAAQRSEKLEEQQLAAAPAQGKRKQKSTRLPGPDSNGRQLQEACGDREVWPSLLELRWSNE